LTRDGISPMEFREMAYKEIKEFPSVRLIKDEVIDVQKNEKVFQIFTGLGEVYLSKKLLFATGLIDALPDIDGLDKVYGVSAFICPYCDGWEYRDQPIAIIGHRLADVHFVKALYGWSRDMALFTNGHHDLEESRLAAFHQRGIPIYDQRIERLQHKGGKLQAIELAGGESVPRRGIFLNPGTRQGSLIPHKLGVPTDKLGIYETKEDGQTNIKGLYIAGDSRNHLHQIIHAASDGAKAAVSMNMELLKEDWATFE
ncbi:MAG: NAD(P)/FAD-dependent oxidoreductase, partial [Tuberibacillus sp.]